MNISHLVDIEKNEEKTLNNQDFSSLLYMIKGFDFRAVSKPEHVNADLLLTLKKFLDRGIQGFEKSQHEKTKLYIVSDDTIWEIETHIQDEDLTKDQFEPTICYYTRNKYSLISSKFKHDIELSFIVKIQIPSSLILKKLILLLTSLKNIKTIQNSCIIERVFDTSQNTRYYLRISISSLKNTLNLYRLIESFDSDNKKFYFIYLQIDFSFERESSSLLYKSSNTLNENVENLDDLFFVMSKPEIFLKQIYSYTTNYIQKLTTKNGVSSSEDLSRLQDLLYILIRNLANTDIIIFQNGRFETL